MSSLVARGALSGYIFPFSSPWDGAAVKLIVEEAGGKVTSLSGKTQRYDQGIDGFVVSNGKIHQDLLDIISTVR
jgi:fructose-1,6-bisphosphatase/inositol monophosphatase family enzyme